jgi:hypothetical protein
VSESTHGRLLLFLPEARVRNAHCTGHRSPRELIPPSQIDWAPERLPLRVKCPISERRLRFLPNSGFASHRAPEEPGPGIPYTQRFAASAWGSRHPHFIGWLKMGELRGTVNVKRWMAGGSIGASQIACTHSRPKGGCFCVRKSSRKEEVNSNTETLHRDPAGQRIPPGRAWPAAGSESCVGRGDPRCEA